MRHGPHEQEPEAPPLAPELQMDIPPTSLRAFLGEGLANVANWTNTVATCLDIKDMDIEEDAVVAEQEREIGNERGVIENAGIQVYLGGEGPGVLDQGQGQGGALEMTDEAYYY